MLGDDLIRLCRVVDFTVFDGLLGCDVMSCMFLFIILLSNVMVFA